MRSDRPVPASSFAISAPIETLSPTLTTICVILPAAGDGTSMVALSDSSVRSGWSASTVSPAFTKISMIGTSLKSPMSGIVTSIGAALTGAAGGAAEGGAAGLALAGAAAGFSGAAGGAAAGGAAALPAPEACAVSPSADSTRAMSVPIDTLSPTFATTSATAPATGEGTSIVALSDSSVISD